MTDLNELRLMQADLRDLAYILDKTLDHLAALAKDPEDRAELRNNQKSAAEIYDYRERQLRSRGYAFHMDRYDPMREVWKAGGLDGLPGGDDDH
jgi:hypothetical protein